MDIVITGNCNIDRKKYNVHKVLKKEYGYFCESIGHISEKTIKLYIMCFVTI